MNLVSLRTFIAACALCAVAPFSSAQNVARIVVGFPPGGSADTLARLIADKLQVEWKRSVIVENRPGAGGQVAAAALKSLPNDGSVVMLAPDGLVTTNPFVYKRMPYATADLQPVSLVAEFPFALSTGAESGAKNLSSYVEWVKAHPKSANFGSPAAGAPPHFIGVMVGRDIGVPMVHVPYQGSAPLVTAVMSGEISAGVATLTDMIELHRAGKIRVLGISSAQRASVLPEVPTFAELGYKQLVVPGRYVVFAPLGTSADSIKTWNTGLSKVMALPDVRQRLSALGMESRTGTPEEATTLLKDATRLWEPAIKTSGFVVE